MMNAIGTSAACGIPIALAGSISYIFIGYGNINLPENSIGYIYLPATIIVGLMSSLTAKDRSKYCAPNETKKIKNRLCFFSYDNGTESL